MERPPADCSCGLDLEDTVAPTAAENAVRIAIATLPAYALEPALRDYERCRPACCAHDALMRFLRSA